MFCFVFPGQARRGDLLARGQGQGRLHLARGVLRAKARRAVKKSVKKHSFRGDTSARTAKTKEANKVEIFF